MKWLYIYFPRLYLEAYYHTLPAGQALALKKEHSHRILDCNPSARDQGVTPGMLLNTAFCLSPALKVEIWQPYQAQQALTQLAREVFALSAWVALDGEDGLYLEIASMREYFGSYAAIRHKLQKCFAGHYQYQIAAAPTAKCARLLSRSGNTRGLSQARMLDALRTIPLHSLPQDEQTQNRLDKLGLTTLGDLMRLPTPDIAYRISAQLAQELAQITGSEHWEPHPIDFPEAFTWSTDLEQEFDSLIPLRFPMTHGLKKFCIFMQERCCTSQNLTLSLTANGQHCGEIQLALAVPDSRLESWVYRLNVCIEKTRLACPITGFRLDASDFIPLSQRSAELFNESGKDEEAKSLLINRLAARLGIGHVHFLNLSDDMRPERQTIYSSQSPERAPEPDPFSLRPLWLLPSALPVDITHYTLIRGPVRLSTGWIDNHKVNRDYYIARGNNHALHWIYLTPEQRWMWHGIFA